MQLCIHAKVTFAVTGALVGYATYWLYKKYAPRPSTKGKSKGNLYETDELLNQYLSFHFGEAEDIGLSKIGWVQRLPSSKRGLCLSLPLGYLGCLRGGPWVNVGQSGPLIFFLQ